MKIALLWPDYWPYVRRGTERMTHDIAHHLAGQGHEVHVLTTKPGRGAVRDEDGVRVVMFPQRSHPLFTKARWVPRFDTHALQVLPTLLRERYDLVHAFFYTYAPALAAAKRLRGTQYVYHVVQIPPAWPRRGDEALLKAALADAGSVRVFSQFCGDYVRDHYGVEAMPLAPSVDQAQFAPVAPRVRSPRRILFTGDLAEERKGAHWLVEAFNLLHRRLPDTQLVLAGPTGFDVSRRVLSRIAPDVADAVVYQGVGLLADLPATYAGASVTVLPARGEPFGMVVTESLSAGTPVVGARSGALPEIITDPGIGRLFDLVDGDDYATAVNLADALEQALALADQPGIEQRCREHARQYTWDALGPQLDALQTAALGERAGRWAA